MNIVFKFKVIGFVAAIIAGFILHVLAGFLPGKKAKTQSWLDHEISTLDKNSRD